MKSVEAKLMFKEGCGTLDWASLHLHCCVAHQWSGGTQDENGDGGRQRLRCIRDSRRAIQQTKAVRDEIVS